MSNNFGFKGAAVPAVNPVAPKQERPQEVKLFDQVEGLLRQFQLGQLNENEQQFLGELLDKAEPAAHLQPPAERVPTPRPVQMSETARIRLNHEKAEYYVDCTEVKLQDGIRRGRVRFSNSSIDIDSIVHPPAKELPKIIDIEEHKQLMKKFRKDYRRRERWFRERSMLIERKIRDEEEQEKRKSLEKRQREVSERRKRAEDRLKEIELEKQEREKSITLANQRFDSVRDSKTLEDIYTERFTKQFVLPEIEEKKSRLERIKEMVKPINFEQLKEHQRLYFERKREKELAKQKSSELQHKENVYKPPEFVPTSYLIVEREEEDRKLQEMEKEEKHLAAARNKQKLLGFLEEEFRERVKKNKLQKRMKRTERESRTVETAPLTYQQARQRGNTYLQEMKKLVKRKPIALIKIEPDPPTSKLFPADSEHGREQIAKERDRIRSMRIANIIGDQKCASSQRQTLLKNEAEKLDDLVHQKDQVFKLRKPQPHEIEETEGIVLNSVHAKLALLQLSSPKKRATSKSQRAFGQEEVLASDRD